MYLALQRYSRPRSIDECLRLLHAPGERAALLSGGTDLNAGGHEHLTEVIDLQALPIDAIERSDDDLRLGARLTLGRVRRHEALAGPWFSALRDAAAAFAQGPIQNRATLGGRIASDRADLDIPPALLALGARLQVCRLRDDKVVEETIDYPTGAAREALHGALIAGVVLPSGDGVSALRRFGRTAVDVPLATCAVSRRRGVVRAAANMQGPSAADLRRLPGVETLAGAWGDRAPSGFRAQVRDAALAEVAEWGDAWASGGYRRDLTATLVVRAIASVFGEAETE